jgi:hypothetical protein
MTATDTAPRGVTEKAAERHAARLREVAESLRSGTLRLTLISYVRLSMIGSPVLEYGKPELEVRDDRGEWRASVAVAGTEYRITLPGGTVHVQKPRQVVVLLAGAS